jgi:hypothetical protein
VVFIPVYATTDIQIHRSAMYMARLCKCVASDGFDALPNLRLGGDTPSMDIDDELENLRLWVAVSDLELIVNLRADGVRPATIQLIQEKLTERRRRLTSLQAKKR